jgi:hypothetical protein
MNGTPFLDNQGNVIQDETDTNGAFLLPIPHDQANPDFVKVLEGFIECHPPEKDNLGVSFYLNTKGLRRGERLVGLKVDPAASVSRQIFERLRVADRQADLVAINARLLADVNGLLTDSPRARTQDVNRPENCGFSVEDTTRSIDIALQLAPIGDSGMKVGMAAYISSQLFLAAFKGEDPLVERLPDANEPPNVEECDDLCANQPQPCPPPPPTPISFRQALDSYYTEKTVGSQDLRNLGLQQDMLTTFLCDT